MRTFEGWRGALISGVVLAAALGVGAFGGCGNPSPFTGGRNSESSTEACLTGSCGGSTPLADPCVVGTAFGAEPAAHWVRTALCPGAQAPIDAADDATVLVTVNPSFGVSLAKGILTQTSDAMKVDEAVARMRYDGSFVSLTPGADVTYTDYRSTADGGIVAGGGFATFSGQNVALGAFPLVPAKKNQPSVFIARFDPSGSVVRARAFGSSHGVSLAVRPSGGYLAFAGAIDETLSFGGPDARPTLDRGAILAVFGEDDAAVWQREIGFASAANILAGKEDRIFVAGAFDRALDLDDGVTLPAPPETAGVVAAFDADGAALWARSIVGASDGVSVSRDAHGDVYAIAPNRHGQDVTFDVGDGKRHVGRDLLVKYASEGDVLWATTFSGGELAVFPTTRDGRTLVVQGRETVSLTIVDAHGAVGAPKTLVSGRGASVETAMLLGSGDLMLTGLGFGALHLGDEQTDVSDTFFAVVGLP